MQTAEDLSRLATGYWPSAALIAAVELNVFDAIGDGPPTAAAIAERTGTDVQRLVALLDALCAIGVLVQSGGGYTLPPALRPLLSRTSPVCMIDALRYNADLYRQWANLADVIRGNAPALANRQLGGDAAMTRRFVLGMEAKARAFAPALIATLYSAGVRSLLDVGAGPGTVSRLLAEQNAEMRATLLDLPAVLAVSREINAASPAAARLSYVPADYRTDALPVSFDALLYAGALHQETPASAASLFASFATALRPGGQVWVVDLMLDASRTSPTFSALFQLNMMLLRPGSRVFGVNEAVALLTAAGFADAQWQPIDGTPYRLVRARRA